MKVAIEEYAKRKKRFEALLNRQTRSANIISNLRLLVFLLGLASAVAAYMTKLYILFGAGLLAFAVLFVRLVIIHERLITNSRFSGVLININEACLKRCNDEWTDFEDTGEEFADEDHRYTGDLDIFGKASLFQWMNCAKTYLGRIYLADLLSGNTGNTGDLKDRQEAAGELSGGTAWRQRLQAEGMMLREASKNPEQLVKWASEKYPFYERKDVVLVIRALPVVTAVMAILSFAFSLIPWFIPVTGLLLQYLLLKLNSKQNALIFKLAEKHSDGIKTYSRMLKLFEGREFESETLKAIKARMTGSDGKSSYRQVERLAAVMDMISNRSTPFYIIFNIIALWDYQNLIALERWKKESGGKLGEWLAALGEAEAVCSLSLIKHDHPRWAWPVIDDGPCGYEAAGMGHPLLNSKKRVVNDMRIKSPVKILLVTGSNMSGKSTFLRTAGINLVLACAGAPVCAASLRAPYMEIHTCMRIGDNLEKNISSFYAELVRIKSIVEAVDGGRKVFFLLDEIFKGTNSIDRHAGASVLIRKLSESDSLGMVSTHDLELCTLAGENEKLQNCHFREYYNKDGIFFDYKLQPGASTTRNAAYLMKLAGIDTLT